MKAKFVISAPMSGSGKTTVARGLMAVLTRHGYSVQPFKCGPDYIDTKFHEAVCRRPSVNLDTFMASPGHLRRLFDHYSAEADVSVVEGMMGLFDGYQRDRGSTAEVASLLHLPVVLVVDARSAAYSVAALLKGFTSFRPDVVVAGVIYNKVGSPRHESMLRQVCSDLGLACLGCLPKSSSLAAGERYLGLDFTQPMDSSLVGDLVEQHVDWQAIAALGTDDAPATPAEKPAGTNDSLTLPYAKASQPPSFVSPCRHVVVARSAEAFSFVYQEVLDSFGSVTFFDPATEVPTLDAADMLYLPGGYPERHLPALAAAEDTLRAIRQFAERGGSVVAECGGMMYLCKAIVADGADGQAVDYPLCGVLPYTVTARQADRRLSLGYRRFTLDGREYRGHEFHYTQLLPPVASATQVYDGQGREVATPVFRYKNVLASYVHLYNPVAWIER